MRAHGIRERRKFLSVSEYVLYEDDGESMEYAKGQKALTRIRGQRSAKRIEVTIAAPKGLYKGMPSERTNVVRCRLDEGEKVRSAKVIHGKDQPRAVNTKTTRRCRAGMVKSAWRFCEVAVCTRNQPVKIVMDL